MKIKGITSLFIFSFVLNSSYAHEGDKLEEGRRIEAAQALFQYYMEDRTTADKVASELAKDPENFSWTVKVFLSEIQGKKNELNSNDWERIVELQTALDEQIEIHNRNALRKQKKYRAWGNWGGATVGLVASAGSAYLLRNRINPMISLFVIIPVGTAAGWGVGTSIGEGRASRISLIMNEDLLFLDNQEIDELKLRGFTPVELFEQYMSGHANAIEVAVKLVRKGKDFKKHWEQVRAAAKNRNKHKVKVLEHALRMKIGEHNSAILNRIQVARKVGAYGGAIVAGGYMVWRIRRAGGEVGVWETIFTVAAASVGGSLGYFISPAIYEYFERDPIETESAFD